MLKKPGAAFAAGILLAGALFCSFGAGAGYVSGIGAPRYSAEMDGKMLLITDNTLDRFYLYEDDTLGPSLLYSVDLSEVGNPTLTKTLSTQFLNYGQPDSENLSSPPPFHIAR